MLARIALLGIVLVAAGCLAPASEPPKDDGGDAPPPPADLGPLVAYVSTSETVEPVPVPEAMRTLSFARRSTGHDGPEPTLGITKDGAIYFVALEKTLKSEDRGRTWKVLPNPTGLPTTLDPFLWVDPATGRVFTLHLYVGCSWLSYSDDGGATWITNPAACGLPGDDHQSIATGKRVQPRPAALYESVVYQCYAWFGTTACATSHDGGVSWTGTPAAIRAREGCGGLNGHVRAGPDGVVYVPLGSGCDAPAVAVSKDEGVTWTVHTVSRAHGYSEPGDDPAIAIDAANTAYMVFVGDDALPYFSKSRDQGGTWSEAVRASPPAITSSLFAKATAGDAGRVAFAYYATESSTANWSSPYSNGATPDAEWHLYVTFSLDGDQETPTFTTLRVTPEDDPIQRGVIWNGGGSRPDRNLLDFFDMTIDRDGRVVIAYADGCDACSDDASSRDRTGWVAVLESGPSLLAGRPPLPPS